MHELTPVDLFINEGAGTAGWWCKREDRAAFTGPELPSGSKVRQYAAMAKAATGSPMLVGCNADSAMQIYVAAAAAQAGVKGIIYTARRAKRSAATEYAIAMGAEVNEVGPGGYLSVLRARAKERKELLAKEHGESIVQWSAAMALRDAMNQCANIPEGVKRIVVPTGSGLTAAGVLAGASQLPQKPTVVVVAVSPMASSTKILEGARNMLGPEIELAPMQFVRLKLPYSKPKAARLPDGTPLDPFYAAKALPLVQPGDCLWPPGLRPVCAMPKEIRKFFEEQPVG